MCLCIKYHRCAQPAQQHGRRFPASSSVAVLSMWFFLVSGFLVDIVQQIHSLRASGVMSSHLSKTDSSAIRMSFKSWGSLWGTPSEIVVFAINTFYICYFFGSSFTDRPEKDLVLVLPFLQLGSYQLLR